MEVKMKAIIIAGSERRYGITSAVAEKTRKLLKELGVETIIIFLNEIKFSPCNGCGGEGEECNYRSYPCEKKDDIPDIIKSMINADIIIYACPVHAFGVCHLMQIFLERVGVGYLRFNRPLANKIGGCIIIGRKYHLGHAYDQIINNMLLNRMIVPGAGFPVLIHGNELTKDISDTEEKVALEQMSKRLVEMYKSIDFKKLSRLWLSERDLSEMAEGKYEKH